jgi:hypothetical protein
VYTSYIDDICFQIYLQNSFVYRLSRFFFAFALCAPDSIGGLVMHNLYETNRYVPIDIPQQVMTGNAY